MKIYDIYTGQLIGIMNPEYTLEQILESFRKNKTFRYVVIH